LQYWYLTSAASPNTIVISKFDRGGSEVWQQRRHKTRWVRGAHGGAPQRFSNLAPRWQSETGTLSGLDVGRPLDSGASYRHVLLLLPDRRYLQPLV